MIASVSGTLTHKGAETALVDNNGLEWELHTSSRSLEALPAVGSDVHVYTHLHHREDQMRLYGIGSAELAEALEAGDLPRLTQIPGLGTKTAQKMILALKGKLTLAVDGVGQGSDGTGAGGRTPSASGVEADLTAALVKMGFGQRESREAVQSALRAAREAGVEATQLEEQVLRMAAAQLSSLTTGD